MKVKAYPYMKKYIRAFLKEGTIAELKAELSQSSLF